MLIHKVYIILLHIRSFYVLFKNLITIKNKLILAKNKFLIFYICTEFVAFNAKLTHYLPRQFRIPQTDKVRIVD